MTRFTLSLITICVLASAGAAFAVPVTVTHNNSAACDPLFVPNDVHELGTAGFPANESILASDAPTPLQACIGGGAVETLVSITNVTGIDWDEVWYVTDPETTIANFDGTVNGEQAFRIDAVGINAPLVAEIGGFLAGVFEAGETWDFIIEGYFNTFGLTPSAFASVGLVGALSAGDSLSTGSIIATPRTLPEPSALLFLAMGAALAARRARA